MFGLFKPKMAPDEPMKLLAELEIAKPAAEVYALIDWADERNAKRATGNSVEAVEGKPGHYVLTMPIVPDKRFEVEETSAVPHSEYGYNFVIKPEGGKLLKTYEVYQFEEAGPENCKLSLMLEATFVSGMKLSEYQHEAAMMAASIQSAMQKLKLQAEHGDEVAKAIEGNALI